MATFFFTESKARLQPYSGDNDAQLWVICGDRICKQNHHNHVLDIKEASSDDGAKLLAYEWHGNENQRWEIQYA